MTSKERIRAVLERRTPDRVPSTMQCVETAWEKLMRHFGVTTPEEIQEILDIDTRIMDLPPYIGPEHPPFINANGETEYTHPFGYRYVNKWNGVEYNWHTVFYPLGHIETWEQFKACDAWPNPDHFDYAAVKDFCDRFPDRAIRVGWPGPYQVFTMLYPAEKFYVMMMDEPELTKAMLDKYCDLSLEIYLRMFEAAGDRIDILRCCDDYGSQRGLLFGPEMWDDFFADNTRRFVELAHAHNCYYLQHSCGAIRRIIPNLVRCGVDCIEPIQKVAGMEAGELKREFGDSLCFQGGVDTQGVLPLGTPEEVREETERIIRALQPAYILAPSQDIEGDVPVANILALYDTRKRFS